MTSSFPVALVSMPFDDADRPSIQLGLLKAVAERHGFPTRAFQLSLDFARLLGRKRYGALKMHRGHFFGDWLFSVDAFGDEAPDPDARLLEDMRESLVSKLEDLHKDPARMMRRIRDDSVPKFLDRAMRIPWGDYAVVGFSSTFQQNAASFALARRIKERHPDVVLLFGGSNFDGDMGLEYVRSVKCVDYAIIGEADDAFPAFLAALRDGTDPMAVAGVARRNGTGVEATPGAIVEDMNQVPAPDYDDFFERAKSLGMRRKRRRKTLLPIESARGCWWGQKEHCTFCGLNNNGMVFRAKDGTRFLDELAMLNERHGTRKFAAVDNILDMSYLRDVLPELIARGTPYRLFYETKANLRPDQVKLLVDSGIRMIQPGIESLSSHVLRLMRKGVSAGQNVNLLRWASYYGMHLAWNIIWGFPGETEEDYREQIALLPHLIHLAPPVGAGRIWMERFSPAYFERDTHPVKYMRPEASYTYVYPSDVDLERAAYFFDYEFEDALPDEVYEPVQSGVDAWRAAWQGVEKTRRKHRRAKFPSMIFTTADGAVRIDDRRDLGAPATHDLEGLEAKLYAACSDRPEPAARLARRVPEAGGVDEIARGLEGLHERGLMMRDGDNYLSLAVPAPGSVRSPVRSSLESRAAPSAPLVQVGVPST
jgi:ribosomal peptide maturation radical SAM protein 1